MYMRRKAYDQLLHWKQHFADQYAIMLEGARRVGKSTIAREFARRNYKSYILIDFSCASPDIRECFNDVSNMDRFFLNLQAATNTTLHKGNSVIIFDEVQLFPQARQAIKHLVKDGRYHYIETGSLISIKKNVKDILIPSEEMKLRVHPMDYEEFLWATQQNYDVIKQLYTQKKAVGGALTQKLMRDLRVYIAVGGMPQAVQAYVQGSNFAKIDQVKRQIIKLYEEDFKKIDMSGKLSALYHAIPAQLAKNTRKYSIASAIKKRKSARDDELLYDLIDSCCVVPCYNSCDPRVSLSQTKDLATYKLYLADTGLFVTLLFCDRPVADNVLYTKLLSDKLPANLGYLYENLVAQMITASNRELFYHTWNKPGSTHYYEIDFLLSCGAKLDALEVKSSGLGKHESLTLFQTKYSQVIHRAYLLSQKDFACVNTVHMVPLYAAPALIGSET